MPNVGTASVDLEVDGRQLGSNIRRAVNSQSSGITSMFGGLGRSAGNALSAGFSGAVHIIEKVGMAAGVAGVALGGFGLKLAGDFQQTRIAFEGILGSAEKAQAFLTRLRDFAAKTPFELPELAAAAKQLLAVGFAASDVIPIMTKLGNVAATLGVGGEAINGVVRALGQMKGKGKASAEELNQISEQIPGFSAVKAIAEKMGVSTAAAFKSMEKGAVSADFAIEAILEGMERFPGAAGAMERQSRTLNGVISTLKDTFKNALIDGIEPFLPAIASGLEKSAPLVQRGVAGIIGALKTGIQGVRDFVTEFRLVERVKDAWPGIKDAITGAVGAAVAYVQENWPKINGVFESGLNAVKGAIELAEPVIGVFAKVGDDLVQNLPKLSGVLDGVAGAFRGVGGFIGEHIEGFKELAEIVGVIMVARLVALKVQLLLTFGAEVIGAIKTFVLATAGAEVALAGGGAAAGAGGVAGAAGVAGLSLGGLALAAATLAGGFGILERTMIDHNSTAEKMTIRALDMVRQFPGVGEAIAGVIAKVAGLSKEQIEADRTARGLTDRLVAYARGWHATVTIDTSQARTGIQNLRDDLALLNYQIAQAGPGGGRGAGRNQVQEQIDQESAGSNNSNTGTVGDPEAAGSDADHLPDRAHGIDQGPLPGPRGEPLLIRAHGGEWVVTPEQMEELTSGRSGGTAAGSGIDYDRLAAALGAVLAANPSRSYVVASDVARGLHDARLR